MAKYKCHKCGEINIVEEGKGFRCKKCNTWNRAPGSKSFWEKLGTSAIMLIIFIAVTFLMCVLC